MISHIFREPEVFLDTEWERYFCYKDIVVPDVYTGPHLMFPLSVSNVTDLVEAFKQKQVGPAIVRNTASSNVCRYPSVKGKSFVLGFYTEFSPRGARRTKELSQRFSV